jgi:hypothetical protein
VEKESEAPSVCSIKSSKIKDNSSIITKEEMSSVLGKREQDACNALACEQALWMKESLQGSL